MLFFITLIIVLIVFTASGRIQTGTWRKINKRVIAVVVPTIITTLFLMFFFFSIPAVFLGSVIYSVIADVRPSGNTTRSLWFSYFKHMGISILFGTAGWTLYVFFYIHPVDFLNLYTYLPGLFSIIYFHVFWSYHSVKKSFLNPR